uniref:Tf2-1-like SH3-like domain-containing protein n=1 Tax=Ananas comosus var. bracteatus TaxID=296719 RepID=A0A6V7NY00_ANACO|nr:unnamed protein product [Ananas comosus var. bracteatus]
MRGVKRFGVRRKLSPRYIGLYEVLERIGTVAYRLALPPKLADVHNVFHVSNLRKFIHDPEHAMLYKPPELQEDLSYEEFPVMIIAREVRKLRNREIPYVKIRLLALGGYGRCCPFGVCLTRPNWTKLVAVSGRDTLFSNKPPAYLLQCPHTVDSRPVYPKREATYAPISSDQSPSP